MLKVHTKRMGTVKVLNLEGQIVKGETESLRTAVRSLSRVNTIILDFACVTTVDAGGLGVMLELREQTRAKGIRMALMNISPSVKLVLAITRLDSVFEITSGAELFRAVPRGQRASGWGVLAPCA